MVRKSKTSLKVVVEKGLGVFCGASDSAYESAGAILVDSADEVWKQSHLVLKVKQPLSTKKIDEFSLMASMPVKSQTIFQQDSQDNLLDDDNVLVIGIPREVLPDEGRAALLPSGVSSLLQFAETHELCSPHDLSQTVMTYFHFIDYKDMTYSILNTKCTSISLEAITSPGNEVHVFNKNEWIDNYDKSGLLMPSIVKRYKEKLLETLCCLDPMSVVAGIEAVLQGIVYLNEEKVKIIKNNKKEEEEEGNENNEKMEEEIVVADQEWVDSVLENYPVYTGDLLQGKTVFIVGNGTCGLSSLYLAEKCGAKIILSVRSEIPRVEGVLKEYYGKDVIAVATSQDISTALQSYKIVIIEAENQKLIKEAFEVSCLNIGTAVGKGGKAVKPIPAQVIKQVSEDVPMRRIMMDVAVDNFYIVHPSGYCDEDFDAVCSHHSNPVKAGYKGMIYYMVGNMPGRPGRISEISSLILQESRLPFVEMLLEHGLREAARNCKGLRDGISTYNGYFTDKEVADGASFPLEYTPIEQVLNL